MKKKLMALMLISSLMLSACGGEISISSTTEPANTGVVLEVSTMYAGNDSNSKNFHEAVAAWEKETGYMISDTSSTADEAYKSRVIMEFQAGAESDVLFYFSGVDANTLVANKRVMSMDTIREEFPEYALNMKESMMMASPYDGKIYCIPVNGYWEALFVNKDVCKKVGVKIPDETTDWKEFLEICEGIKKAGYTPIAASLSEVPHYWFEYCIYNHQNPDNHATVPGYKGDTYSDAWIEGLNDIKDMYDAGYFPANTLSASDAEAKKLFTEGNAAFLLEGSWNVSWLEEEATHPEDYMVTFVPGCGERKATDIISGLSTGYYITKKAWDDPKKRAAAVSFVEYMTSDTCVSKFAEISATALVNGVSIDKGSVSDLVASALDMAEGATATSEAVQDYVPANCRTPIFENMPALMKGDKAISEAVYEVVDLINSKGN